MKTYELWSNNHFNFNHKLQQVQHNRKMTDPGIICYQHCGAKIFTLQLPELCHMCKQRLTSQIIPFRLPFPFIKASQYPCSVVLRPTNGDFLNDYYNNMDLHIGVTTSTGAIVEFDRCGLRRQNQQNLEHNPTDDTTTKLTPQSTLHQSLMMKNSNAIRSCTSGGDGTNVVGVTTTAGKPRNLDTGYSKWNQSLLVEQVPEEWCEHWDTVLEEICRQPHWTAAAYQEDSHNCYAFVLAFLKALEYDSLSQFAENKTEFCEKFIVPRTTAAGKYISLYRKIRDHGFYIHLSTNTTSTTATHSSIGTGRNKTNTNDGRDNC